ncbi:hypothetical protein L6E12_23645 [Actinokineospora sp. PR83]|uniref:hypothetical protein n=1 Tax=Actinokineospora sp. PR83 TaxID=2884908 RepID=UPI001F47CD8E|nr:hypothetical protein [Actinokineospora sp. PR83]MCG8918778.1 hypothetical protein [Actinokineospora sp. PR83]
MLRRGPGTILTAHKMDPNRRELYVEGTKDRAFLKWISGHNLDSNTTVQIIDSVDMADVDQGGNRQRLIDFLRTVEDAQVQIRGLIDLDHGKFVEETYPVNSWVTDYRDMEGYVLGVSNIEKALKLGYGIEMVDAHKVFNAMCVVAKYLTAVRLSSQLNSWRLPVSEINLRKYVKADSQGGISIDKEKIIKALLQAAEISLTRMTKVVNTIQETIQNIDAEDPVFVCHGKDAMKLLSVQFKALGVPNVSDVSPIIWTTFDPISLRALPNLNQAVAFLLNKSAIEN